MTLEHYQELAPKTLKDKGYEINCLHMALGMAGEIEEIFEAADEYFRDDTGSFRAALLEEGTDIKWFVVVLGSLKGVHFNSKRLAAEPKQVNENDLFHNHIRNLVHQVLTLTDVVKREICYGKAKYQGLEVTPVKYEQLMYKALAAVDQMFADYDLFPEEGYDLNIQKLHKIRYKDGFSTEAATNRDLGAEAAIKVKIVTDLKEFDELPNDSVFERVVESALRTEGLPLDEMMDIVEKTKEYAVGENDLLSKYSEEDGMNLSKSPAAPDLIIKGEPVIIAKSEEEATSYISKEARDKAKESLASFLPEPTPTVTKLADVTTDELLATVPQEILDTPVEVPVTSSGSVTKDNVTAKWDEKKWNEKMNKFKEDSKLVDKHGNVPL